MSAIEGFIVMRIEGSQSVESHIFVGSNNLTLSFTQAKQDAEAMFCDLVAHYTSHDHASAMMCLEKSSVEYTPEDDPHKDGLIVITRVDTATMK